MVVFFQMTPNLRSILPSSHYTNEPWVVDTIFPVPRRVLQKILVLRKNCKQIGVQMGVQLIYQVTNLYKSLYNVHLILQMFDSQKAAAEKSLCLTGKRTTVPRIWREEGIPGRCCSSRCKHIADIFPVTMGCRKLVGYIPQPCLLWQRASDYNPWKAIHNLSQTTTQK